MRSKRRAATIQDVAREAGVSVSTVSRVLNRKVDVAPETQDRIIETITRLGYTSSLAARSMRSRRKNLIGLVLPDIGFPYSIEIMRGVERAIAESAYDLLLYTTGGIHKVGVMTREQEYVSLLSNSLVDGIVVVATSASEFSSVVPIVAVDPHDVVPGYPAIQAANYEGALEAMDYLLGLGHRRIGFIKGRPEIGSAQSRLKGYQDALRTAGIPLEDDLVVAGDFSTSSGHAGGLKLLALKNPPTAIFAANDQCAMGVLQAAEESGIIIPDDLSVIGFDNISEARHLGLTTIDQFLNDMGYQAIHMLIKLINDEPLENQICRVPTQIVVRSSCRVLVRNAMYMQSF